MTTENLHRHRSWIKRTKEDKQRSIEEIIHFKRSQEINGAQLMMNDSSPESVLLDSMVHAYLRNESAKNPERFLPWLKSIVKSHVKDTVKVPDLIVSLEWEQTITTIMNELSSKSRTIFESYYLQQLSLEVIAKKYNVSLTQVVTILAESKLKIQNERYIQALEDFVECRNQHNMPIQGGVQIPIQEIEYDTLGKAIYDIISFISPEPWSLSNIVGLTGQAFRIQLTSDVGISSGYIYPWEKVVRNIGEMLGSDVYSIGAPHTLFSVEMLIQSHAIIHDALDLGVPVIVWNLQKGALGVIYSYNDKERMYSYRDNEHEHLEVPYSELRRSLDSPELFLAAFRPVEHNFKLTIRVLRKHISQILDHLHGLELDAPGYTSGLSAYDVWIRAVGTEQLDIEGHAYNIAKLTEARQQAAFHFQQLSDHLLFETNPGLRVHILAAAEQYHLIYEHYLAMYPTLSCLLPGEKLDMATKIKKQLQQIQKAEYQAMEHLEQIKTFLGCRE
ncbi:putative DNA-binding protein YlxM (UPF0122 family) [Paenibacillus shirakamiensis]|uniref:DNA-binding protein YlxM (UPF0122 family) n=1 Tax=Paenibacillus shirakamiensis TaxID=1265935 RepID=A0ABS4JDQ2_9BACL|nr:sigma-70 family RNA polymerase sigma factor [Paenibacillus shirakamiensis]MBP1999857.1 putative DNA-binding protein YlxM (UPF0122 family) [Paenibacillus shirakamiensis]